MATALYATPGSGPLSGSIGWFNYGNLSLTPGQKVHITNILRDGSTIDFDLTNTTLAGSGTTFTGRTPPLGANTPFGITNYTGINGNVILYSGLLTVGASSIASYSNIVVKDVNGNLIPNYLIVMSHAEASGLGEKDLYITNGGTWNLLTVIPAVGGGGPPSSPSVSGVGTQTITLLGANGLPYTSPVFTSLSPSQVDFNPSSPGTNGLEGVALGIVLTSITLKKVISNRISSTDQFSLNITGTPSSTATTTGSSIGSQGVYAEVFGTSGNTYTINESMASGSSSLLSQYSQTITCSNLTPGGTSFPSNPSLGSSFTLAAGDAVVCTITNTPINPTVILTKNVNKVYGNVGDTLTYTILVNVGATSSNNSIFYDTIPSGTTFVNNSFTINGSSIAGIPNPPTGISLQTLPIGVTTLTFKVIVNTIPLINPIPNFGTLGYDFTQGSITTTLVNSNTVTTQINNGNLGGIYKSVDKSMADCHDYLTYTIIIPNSGNVTALNVFFIDTTPNGTIFVPNSLTINGTPSSSDPNSGITLPNISPSSVLTLVYKVFISC